MNIRNSTIILAAAILFSPLAQGSDTMLTLMDTAQVQSIAARHVGETALMFTESRGFPIRHSNGLPARWSGQAQSQKISFAGVAQPGEFFVFQLGIYALTNLGPISLTFSDLKGDSGMLPAGAFNCLSLGGLNFQGQPFTKGIHMEAGQLQALWVGVTIPVKAKGRFVGNMQLDTGRDKKTPVELTLQIEGPALADQGDSSAGKLSRLRWLNSNTGTEPTLTKPFTAVRTGSRVVKVLGRELLLGENGLPKQILSHFSPANTRIEPQARPLLARPAAFLVETSTGKQAWQDNFGSLKHNTLKADWTATSTTDGLRTETCGHLDYTGAGEIRIRLIADRDLDLKDVGLEVPFREDSARYFMGLNHPGGLRPESVQWKWDVQKHQDCFWLGALNAGLMLRLKDGDYLRPPVNIYYAFRPLALPSSWGNEGRGGVELRSEADSCVLARAYSGPRRLKQGQHLDFTFELYLTPFRTLDTEKQWSVRFIQPSPSHLPDRLDQAVASADSRHGPNVINVHQGTYYSPYINYPYSDASASAFHDLVQRAHAKGVKVRVYYTTREITQNMPELFPLHSLNGEIILPGPGKEARTLIHPGGPHPWLTENLISDFIPAWVDHVGGKYAELDLSVITTPDSRWNNFYLEGLRWLADKSDFDGVYIDDTALDAGSLRRARRILDTRSGRYMDLHTWNHFNSHAGFANNLTIYMELLPYLDRLWLGEGFNANTAPADFWLVEMSGLPFGLMSEMLEGANPWRGMVFGETSRLGWSGDPRGLWKVWDEFAIQGTEFLPSFAPGCPVATGEKNILATVYRKKGRSFIALASWAEKETSVKLRINWSALGLDPARATLYAPAIAGMQPERLWQPAEEIPIKANQGWFLVLDQQPRKPTIISK